MHRLLHVARGDQRPDPGGGDGLAVDLHQRHDPRLELLARGEHLGIALRLRAEAEVLPDRDALRSELLDQDLLDELLGADLGELAVERDHDQLLDPEPVDHIALHLEGHDQLRRRLGMDHGQGMGIEGEHGVGIVDHGLVAEVDAVEGADRDVPISRLGVGQLV